MSDFGTYDFSNFEAVWNRMQNSQNINYLDKSTETADLRKLIEIETEIKLCLADLSKRIRQAKIGLVSMEKQTNEHIKNLQMEYFLEKGDIYVVGKSCVAINGLMTGLRGLYMKMGDCERLYSESLGGGELDDRMKKVCEENRRAKMCQREEVYKIMHQLMA